MSDLPPVSVGHPNHAGVHNAEREKINRALASRVSDEAPTDPMTGAVWVEPGRVAHSLVRAAGDFGRVLAHDTFDRTAGEPLGTSDSGHTWVTHEDLNINASGRVASVLSSGGARVGYMDVGRSDYDVEATIALGMEEGVVQGLVFRYQGPLTPISGQVYLAAWLRPTTGDLLLGKGTGTSFAWINTVVLDTVGLVTGHGAHHRLRVRVLGDDIVIFVDGVVVLTHTLAEGEEVDYATGHPGVVLAHMTSRADDFIVRAA